ncbi:hypothetical protein LTR16_006636, partial [Cryomyces antarcticus]
GLRPCRQPGRPQRPQGAYGRFARRAARGALARAEGAPTTRSAFHKNRGPVERRQAGRAPHQLDLHGRRPAASRSPVHLTHLYRPRLRRPPHRHRPHERRLGLGPRREPRPPPHARGRSPPLLPHRPGPAQRLHQPPAAALRHPGRQEEGRPRRRLPASVARHRRQVRRRGARLAQGRRRAGRGHDAAVWWRRRGLGRHGYQSEWGAAGGRRGRCL